jgi:transposase
MRLRRSRLSGNQTERLLEHFVAGTPARASAALVGVNRNTARLFYHRMREVIVQRLEQASPLQGEVATAAAINSLDMEENGGQRRPPTRAPLFGLIESNGKVHTVLLRNHRPDAVPTAAGAGPRLDAIVYADFHLERQALDVSGLRHQRVADSKRSPRGRPQFDSVESFWSQAKRHLQRYNGIPRRHFHLFLKECEWRFNYGSPAQLLKVLKAWINSSLA